MDLCTYMTLERGILEAERLNLAATTFAKLAPQKSMATPFVCPTLLLQECLSVEGVRLDFALLCDHLLAAIVHRLDPQVCWYCVVAANDDTNVNACAHCASRRRICC